MSAEFSTPIYNTLTITTLMTHPINNWKACRPRKGLGGSNPPHSADNSQAQNVLPRIRDSGKKWQKSIICGKKTAKRAQKMRRVRVSLYFGRSFKKDDTAPLYICVNHNRSSCYIAMQGVRLKRNQWDKTKKKVINHTTSPHNSLVRACFLSVV